MNVISVSIDRVKFEIPREVLQETFMPRRYDPSKQERYRDNQLGVSIDSQIRKEVIDARVAVDVNCCSGVETTIPLHDLPREYLDPWNIIYRIPKDRTGNRSITAVYSITFGEGNVYGTSRVSPTGSSPLLEAAAGVFMAEAPIPAVSSAYCTLIGDNTVLINDAQALPGRMYLRCQLTHEPNFANIRPAYYDVFSELVVLATKAHVHNRLIISLDEGQIKSGVSIGRFREVVDGYADANQMYREYLREKWRLVSTMSDVEKYRRITAMVVGGRH